MKLKLSPALVVVALFADAVLTPSLLLAQVTNLIDVQIAGTYNGAVSTNAVGAAVLGAAGDVWNQYGTIQNFNSGSYPSAIPLNFTDESASSASFAVSSGGQITGTLPTAVRAPGFTAKTGAPNSTVANLYSGTTQYVNIGNPTTSVNFIFTFSNLTAYIGDTFTYEVYYGSQGTATSLTGATGGNTASSLAATAADANINNGPGDAYVQYTGTIISNTLIFNTTMTAIDVSGNGWGGSLVGAQLQLVNSNPPPPPATALLWSNSPADSNWSNGANWAGGNAPSNASQLVFATSSMTTVNNDFTGSNASFAGLLFASNASTYTVNGNGFSIGTAGLANASSNSQVINVALSGIGGVREVGSGTLTLTPGTSNSYTGGNTIGTKGTLVGDSTSIQGTVTDNGKLIFSQTTNGAASGISGTGSVAVSGTGTLTLSGVNSYSGGTALNCANVAVNTSGSIGSGTVTFNANSTIRSIASATIALNNPMVVGSGVNATLDVGTNAASQAELTLEGGISGPGAVTFAATTTNWITIYENNSYSGGTTLNGGIIQWVGSTGPNPFGSGNVTVASNSYLRGFNLNVPGGSVVLTNAITINSGVNLTLTNSGYANTFSGPISGLGSLTLGNTFGVTTTLSASNSYTGTTTIAGGTLALGPNASISSSSTINLGSAAAQGKLDVTSQSNSFAIAANQTLTGYGAVNIGGNTLTVHGNLSPGNGTNVGTITVRGGLTNSPTTVTTIGNDVTGTNYSSINVTAGLNLNGILDLALNLPGFGSTNIFNAASFSGDFTTVTLTGSWNTGSSFTETNGIWSFNSDTNKGLIISFNISNGELISTLFPSPTYLWSNAPVNGNLANGANWFGGAAPTNNTQLVYSSSSTTTLTNDFANGTFSGLYFTNNASAYTITGNTLTIGLEGITNASANVQTITAPLSNSSTMTVTTTNGGGNVVLAGGISGLGGVTAAGTGTTTVGGTNTYTGTTTVQSNSTMQLTGSVSNTPIVSSGTFIETTTGVIAGTNGFTQNGEGSSTLAGTNTYTGATTVSAGTLSLSGSLSNTAVSVTGGTLAETTNGTISGPAGITVSGSNSAANLAGNNSFTGALTIPSGTVILSGNNINRPGTNTGTTVLSGTGVLQLQANSNNTVSGVSYALSPEATSQSSLQWTGGTLQLLSDRNVTFAGGNNAGLVVAGDNLTIFVDQLTSGKSNQTISFAPNGFLTASTTINVTGSNDGYTLALGSLSAVPGYGLILNANGANLQLTGFASGGSLAVGGPNNTTITGTVSDTAGITKTGTGTLVLLGDNSYTGLTEVSQGTLLINGQAGSSTISVDGGTLGGTGTITVPTRIGSGGQLTPGVNGRGSLTSTDALLLNSGSTTSFTIAGTNGATSISLVGDSVVYGGTLDFLFAGYTPQAGDSYTLFNMTAGASQSGDWSSVQEGSLLFSDMNGVWSAFDSGNDVNLTFTDSTGQFRVTAVPEPSTYALFGLGLLALIVSYVRRKAA